MGVTIASGVVGKCKTLAQNAYTELGQKGQELYNKAAENDRVTTSLKTLREDLNPYSNGSKKWTEKPWWALCTIGAAVASLATSIFMICKDKWLAKTLFTRRLVGVMLILPVLYFIGYGVYHAVKFVVAKYNDRMEKKNEAAIAKEQKSIASEYDTQFEQIFKKPAAEQYTDIEKLAKAKKLGLEWTTDSGKNYAELVFAIRGTPFSYKKEIGKELHKVHLQKEAEKKQIAMFKRLADSFQAIENALINPQLTKDEAKGLVASIYITVLKPLGISEEEFREKMITFEADKGNDYIVILKDTNRYYRQKIATEVRKFIEGKSTSGVPIIGIAIDFVLGTPGSNQLTESTFLQVQK